MLLQISLTLLSALSLVRSATPPGYQNKPPIPHDKNPPKYNYGYKIGNEHESQEKQEQRDGIYALGRYYVHGPGSSQSVEYLADDWGFHPFIEYSNVGPHSQSMTQIAFGEEAVKALHNSKNHNLSPKVQVEQSLIKFNYETQKGHEQQHSTQHELQQQQPTQHELQQQQQQPTQQTVINQNEQKDEVIIHHPKSTQEQKQEQQSHPQPVPTYQSVPQEQLFYVTPQNPHQPQQQQTQENVVYVPAQNYLYPTQNPQPQQDQEQYTHYQNMYLVQVNDHLGQPSLALVPQNAIYDQNNAQPEPNRQQIIYQQPQNQDHNSLVLQNVQENIENQAKAEQKPDYYNAGIKTIETYAQKQVTPKYEQDNSVEVQTYNEENAYPIPGAYGTKITTTLRVDNSKSNLNNQGKAYKLIQNTKDLVTGQDVLNINHVLNKDETPTQEASTVHSVIQQYSVQHPVHKQEPEVDVSHVGSASSSFSTASPNTHAYSTTSKTPHAYSTTSNTPYAYSTTSNTPYAYSSTVPSTASTDRVSFVTTERPLKFNLAKDPIVVADLEENNLGSKEYEDDDDKEYFSTTQNTVETAKSATTYDATQSTIVVTPRPVSQNFLAPITAGIQLQSVEDNVESEAINHEEPKPREKVVVEVQKSVPYYLGKFEFVQDVNGEEVPLESHSDYKRYKVETAAKEAAHNMELGKTLLHFGEAAPTPQALIQSSLEEENKENYNGEDNGVNENNQAVAYAPLENKDEAPKQIFYQVPYQQLLIPQYQYAPQNGQIIYQAPQNEQVSKKAPENGQNIYQATHNEQDPQSTPQNGKNVDQVPQNEQVSQSAQQNVKIVNQVLQNGQVSQNAPQTGQIIYQVPQNEQVFQGASQSEQINYEVAHNGQVSQSASQNGQIIYQVTQNEQSAPESKVPGEVTKYIDRPYPVQVRVPYPVEVEKIVEKVVNQPYPVEVPIPQPIHFETIIEKKVPVPIEVRVPVPQPYIVEVPKPYPVQVTKLVPQPYPVQVTQTIKVPVPTPVEVQVPHPIPVEVPKYIDRPYPIFINKDHQFKHNPYQYAPNYQKPMKGQYKLNNGGAQQTNKPQANNKHNSKQQIKHFLPLNGNFYHTIHLNDYIGLKPPRAQHLRQQNGQHKQPHGNLYTLPRKHRNARHSFGSNIRLEYGFMPPLIPSLEIDENGKPIEKNE